MAQTEDTELRDLVIEALERNGSLAKIRALLRANIFLAFEDECENIKQNVTLDNIIKLPDGILALSIVHEFLEFCCLRNTLFVYKSESRQGTDYKYEGKKTVADKLNVPKSETKEPLLMTILKNCKSYMKKYSNGNTSGENHENLSDKNYNDDQNCTYILHEDSQSSTTSNSHSDNSSDEKNKLQLRLQLDNSDTDTSSDSARGQNSSEYIPGDHILDASNNITKVPFATNNSNKSLIGSNISILGNQQKSDRETSLILNDLKLTTMSSSDSTSYIDIKPFNTLDEKLLNTSGLPVVDTEYKNQLNIKPSSLPNDLSFTKSLNMSSKSLQNKENVTKPEVNEKISHESYKSDAETAEYSYRDDFSSSPSKNNNTKSLPPSKEDSERVLNKNSCNESPHQISQSSHSSVSISDVADLISEKSSSNNKSESEMQAKENLNNKQKSNSDDSGEFTDSPVPSLSNLSLDIHSD